MSTHTQGEKGHRRIFNLDIPNKSRNGLPLGDEYSRTVDRKMFKAMLERCLLCKTTSTVYTHYLLDIAARRVKIESDGQGKEVAVALSKYCGGATKFYPDSQQDPLYQDPSGVLVVEEVKKYSYLEMLLHKKQTLIKIISALEKRKDAATVYTAGYQQEMWFSNMKSNARVKYQNRDIHLGTFSSEEESLKKKSQARALLVAVKSIGSSKLLSYESVMSILELSQIRSFVTSAEAKREASRKIKAERKAEREAEREASRKIKAERKAEREASRKIKAEREVKAIEVLKEMTKEIKSEEEQKRNESKARLERLRDAARRAKANGNPKEEGAILRKLMLMKMNMVSTVNQARAVYGDICEWISDSKKITRDQVRERREIMSSSLFGQWCGGRKDLNPKKLVWWSNLRGYLEV